MANVQLKVHSALIRPNQLTSDDHVGWTQISVVYSDLSRKLELMPAYCIHMILTDETQIFISEYFFLQYALLEAF